MEPHRDVPVFVTPHAVHRYRERMHPGMTYERARDALVEAAKRAHPVKPKRNGCWLFRGPKPERLRLIVGPGKSGLPAVVTVETPFDGYKPRR